MFDLITFDEVKLIIYHLKLRHECNRLLLFCMVVGHFIFKYFRMLCDEWRIKFYEEYKTVYLGRFWMARTTSTAVPEAKAPN